MAAVESSEPFARSESLTQELDDLLSRWDFLTTAEQEFALKYAKYVDRGYRVTKYMLRACPTPYPKQELFLSLNDMEAYTGGSTGGGKTSTLLLAALQYVDIPSYSACIFRATYTNLSKPNSIMDRAKSWLIYDGSDVHWNANDCCFTFPSGAKLSFAYMQSQKHADNHRSAEYTFLGYDEVTEIPENCYRFLFSRLRRTKGGPIIPLRCRSASNPGGEHSAWVKSRFIPQGYLDCRDNDYRFERIWRKGETCGDCNGTGKLKGSECFYCDGRGYLQRTFVPSRVQDNPAMDANEYRKALSIMTYVERMQAEHGDWDITAEGGVFRQPWFRQYKQNGDGEYFTLFRFDEHGRPLQNLIIARRDCMVFVTADTATKEKTTADFSVIATWALHKPTGSLLLLDVIRTKVDTPDLLPLLSGACNSAKARFVLIEEASSGVELLQKLRRNNQCIGGIPVLAYLTGSKDKVARSVPAQLRMESGMIFFPMEDRPWKSECLAEVLSFPAGLNDDFVDNLSMASWYAENSRTVHVGSIGDAPVELSAGPRLGGAAFD